MMRSSCTFTGKILLLHVKLPSFLTLATTPSEMAMRHLTTRYKPHLSDHLNSWENYKNVSGLVSTVWVAFSQTAFIYHFDNFPS
jgi:hypothetical protein